MPERRGEPVASECGEEYGFDACAQPVVRVGDPGDVGVEVERRVERIPHHVAEPNANFLGHQ